MTQEDPQEEKDTRETEALARSEDSADADPVEVVPVTPQVDAVVEPVVAVEPEPVDPVDPVAVAPAFEPPVAGGQSPLEADRRGAAQAEDAPIVPIVGAFVGAFVAAKLLGRLGGGDD